MNRLPLEWSAGRRRPIKNLQRNQRVWGERGPVSVVRGPREEAGWGWQCDLSLGLCTAPSLEARLAFGSTKLLVWQMKWKSELTTLYTNPKQDRPACQLFHLHQTSPLCCTGIFVLLGVDRGTLSPLGSHIPLKLLPSHRAWSDCGR